MTIVVIIGFSIVAIIISYIIGRVSGMPNGWCPCSDVSHWESYPSYCKCYLCCPQDYVSRGFVNMEKQQAYEKGKYEGRLEKINDIKYTKFMSMYDQEKFLKRFNECVKPIEELRKDLENGKF